MFLFLSLFLVCLAGVAPPNWPNQFTATALLTLPYGYTIRQPIGISFDQTNNRAKIDYFNGMDSYYYRNDLQKSWMIVPRIDTPTCFEQDGANMPLPTILPTIDNTWTFVGQVDDHGFPYNSWQKNITVLGWQSNHTMLVNPSTGAPYRLTMEGYDFLFGSHPDIYILDYLSFLPFVDSTQFNVPSLCNSAKRMSPRSQARSQAMLGLIDSILVRNPVNQEFDRFQMQFQKTYSSPELYAARLQAWSANMKRIYTHNLEESKHGYSLKMNHLGDFTPEEFSYYMLPNAHKKTTRPVFQAHRIHPEPTAEQLAALPTSIDWREKGAVTMVKDQGVCGSCWTFGTAGSVEGCWAAKYGQLYSLSEQQIVDCAWVDWGGEGGDSGCDGGFSAPALQWIISNNGIALESDYPYLMVDSYCQSNITTSPVKLQGYVNVTGTEAALQHAVATVGPVAVAIDADHDEFVFYSSGVYYNPKCKNDLDDLDHEVLVVGYGSENGMDYWIVKNSWSTHWGDKGYVKMARNRGNNCGIATQPNYPLV